MSKEQKKKIAIEAWRLLWVAWIASSFAQLLTFSYGMMLPQIMTDFSMDYAAIGALGSVASWLQMLANIPIAFIASKVNPKFSLPCIYILFAIGAFLFGNAHTITVLYIGRILIGIGAAGLLAPLTIIKIRTVPPEKIGEVNGIEDFTQPLGQTCATLVMAQILVAIGGWRNVYRIVSVLMLVLAVFWYFFYANLEKKEKTNEAARAAQNIPASSAPVASGNPLVAALKNKTVLLYMIAFPGTIVIWVGFFYFYPSYFIAEHGFTSAQAGLAVGIFPVCSAFASIISSKITTRLATSKYFFVATGVLLSLFYFLTLQVSSLPLLCIISAISGFLAYIYSPAFLSNIFRVGLPPNVVQMGYSLLLTSVALGSAIGSALIGTLSEHLGLYNSLALCCLTPLWFALIMLFTPNVPNPAVKPRVKQA